MSVEPRKRCSGTAASGMTVSHSAHFSLMATLV